MDAADRNDGELDILDLLRFLRRNRRFIAVGAVVGLLAGLGVAMLRKSSDVVVETSLAMRETQAQYIDLVREKPSLERVAKAAGWQGLNDDSPFQIEDLLDLNKRLEIQVGEKNKQKDKLLEAQPDFQIVRLSFRAPTEDTGRKVLEQIEAEINRVTNEFIIQTSSKHLVIEVERSAETQLFLDFVLTDEALEKIVEVAGLRQEFGVPSMSQAIEILRSRISYSDKIIELPLEPNADPKRQPEPVEVVPDRILLSLRIDSMNQGNRILQAIEEALPLYEREKFIQTSGEKFTAAVTFFPHVSQDRLAAYVTDTALLTGIARDKGLAQHYGLGSTESAADVLRGRLSFVSGTEHLRLKGALPAGRAAEGQFFQLLVRDREASVALSIAETLMHELQEWVDANDPSNATPGATNPSNVTMRSATLQLADSLGGPLLREWIKSPSYLASLVTRFGLVDHYRQHVGQLDADEARARLSQAISFSYPDVTSAIGDGSRQLARLETLDLPSERSWIITLQDPDPRKAKELLSGILRDTIRLTPDGLRRALPLAYRERSLVLGPQVGAVDYHKALTRADSFPSVSRMLVQARGSSDSSQSFETRWYWRRAVMLRDAQGLQRTDYESGVSSLLAIPPDAVVTSFEILAPSLKVLAEASQDLRSWMTESISSKEELSLSPIQRLTPEIVLPVSLRILQGVSVSSARQPLRVLSQPVIFNDFATQLRMPKIFSKKVNAPLHAQVQNAMQLSAPNLGVEATHKLNRTIRLFPPVGAFLGALVAVAVALLAELLRREKESDDESTRAQDRVQARQALQMLGAGSRGGSGGNGSSGGSASGSGSGKGSLDGAIPAAGFLAEPHSGALPLGRRRRRSLPLPSVYQQSVSLRPKPRSRSVASRNTPPPL